MNNKYLKKPNNTSKDNSGGSSQSSSQPPNQNDPPKDPRDHDDPQENSSEMSCNELEEFIQNLVTEMFADKHLAKAIRGRGRHQLVKEILKAINNNGDQITLPMQV